jgi:hypothetical protein
MEKNKMKKTAFLFLRLLVFSAFVVFIAGRILAIHLTLKSIKSYLGAQGVTNYITPSGIALLEQEAGELRKMEIPAVETAQTAEDHAAAVRDLLHAQGTRPEQFRIIGKGKDASAEFTLSCPPLPFFNFLLELSKSNVPPLNYISIKPDPVSGNIKSILRLANKVEGTRAFIDETELPSLPSKTLAASFRVPGETKKHSTQAAVSTAAQVGKRAAPVEKNNFKYLGSIKDGNGRERVYIKDTDSGDIVAVDSAIQASVSEDAYVVTIGGNEYFVRRN